MSVDISTNILVEGCWSSIGRYVDRYVDQYVGRYVDRCSTDTSVDIAADTLPIFLLLNIGRLSYNINQKFKLSVSDLYALCLDHVRKFSHYEARHLSEILPNTENTENTEKKRRKKGKVRPSKKKKMLLVWISSLSTGNI